VVRQARHSGFRQGKAGRHQGGHSLTSQRNLVSALEAQITEYLRTADNRLFVLQQRAIAATNARPTPLNFVRAVFSDSVFPQRNYGDVKTTSKGVVKYGRRGEYLLHIGVDEEVREYSNLHSHY
jgi:acetyl-CoA carboxylase alpha subunit